MREPIKKDWKTVHSHIEKILPLLTRKASGWMPFPWIATGCGNPYGNSQFLWDGFHECLRFIYEGKPKHMRHMLSNHFFYQDDSGWMPHAISEKNGFNNHHIWSAGPYAAQGVLLYSRTTGDKIWPAEIYGKLEKLFEFWNTERSAGNNLFCWGMEHGFDNDVALTFFRPRSIAAVSASVLMYMENEAMAMIAEDLGKKKDSNIYGNCAQKIKKAINTLMWFDELNCYANIDLRTGKPIHGLGLNGLPGDTGKHSFASWNCIMPLYPAIAPKTKARRYIEEYIINPEHFWSPHGIRTLSKKSEFYNNAVLGNPARYSDEANTTASNWQGPVWIPVNYFTFHALQNYGYLDKSEELCDKTIRLLASSIKKKGCMFENYHAETGNPLYAPDFASWNILADIMHAELEKKEWILDILKKQG